MNIKLKLSSSKKIEKQDLSGKLKFNINDKSASRVLSALNYLFVSGVQVDVETNWIIDLLGTNYNSTKVLMLLTALNTLTEKQCKLIKETVRYFYSELCMESTLEEAFAEYSNKELYNYIKGAL